MPATMGQQGIEVTGNHQIDQAAAEIAVYLRDASPGLREQHYFDVAMELRDRIMAGTRELDAKLPAWTPASNGTGKMIWFLIRGLGSEGERVPLPQRYHYGPSGKLVRYASMANAQRAADKLNKQEAAA